MCFILVDCFRIHFSLEITEWFSISVINIQLNNYKLEFLKNWTFAGAELKEHQETCIFAKNNCPLSHVMSCKWTGPKMGIVAHCTQEHPANTHTGNHVILKCPLFDLLEGVTAYYFIILQSHSQEFLFCWHIDANGIMQWVLYFLGSPKDRKRFRYTLFIGNPYGDHDPIVMTTGCEQKVEQYDMFSRQHCLTSSYDMVKKRCNKNGDLHYEIKITDKIWKIESIVEQYTICGDLIKSSRIELVSVVR